MGPFNNKYYGLMRRAPVLNNFYYFYVNDTFSMFQRLKDLLIQCRSVVINKSEWRE